MLYASGTAIFMNYHVQICPIHILNQLLPRDLTEKNTLTPPVLNLVGIHSPFIEESVNFNGQLTPSKTNWIKVQEAAMVLEEQPGKVCQALRLFLQGQGFCLKLRNSNLC
jgi:hypothetical protein